MSPALFMADVWADGLMARDAAGKRIPHIATSWTDLAGRQALHLQAAARA